MKQIRVLVVDDSMTMRNLLKANLDKDPRFLVVGLAKDPYEARDQILAYKPDVMTLDIEMPRMDGLTFLDRLLPQYPIPIVMISSLTLEGSEQTLKALSLGAVDFIPKPSSFGGGVAEFISILKEKIVIAASAKIKRSFRSSPVVSRAKVTKQKRFEHVVILGASTGGTEAIHDFLMAIEGEFPPILITQHMPEKFTKMFADRLDSESHLTVVEGSDNTYYSSNEVHIAPGGMHMFIERHQNQNIIRCQVGPKVNSHMPSVDVLMKSAAQYIGNKAVGVMLTGMGGDGAKGMLEMKKNGAYNFAQDEDSCVVFGMPKVAIELGGVDEIMPPDAMPEAILKYLKKVSHG